MSWPGLIIDGEAGERGLFFFFERLPAASLVCPELLPVSADKWERRFLRVALLGGRRE